MQTYAIIKTGGKQYRVSPGDVLHVERLPFQPGQTIELDEVLLVSQGDEVTVGTPHVEGAKVVATVEQEERGEKKIVFKYKSKVRYRRKLGHRQTYTRLAIKDIVFEGGKPRGKGKVKGDGS